MEETRLSSTLGNYWEQPLSSVRERKGPKSYAEYGEALPPSFTVDSEPPNLSRETKKRSKEHRFTLLSTARVGPFLEPQVTSYLSTEEMKRRVSAKAPRQAHKRYIQMRFLPNQPGKVELVWDPNSQTWVDVGYKNIFTQDQFGGFSLGEKQQSGILNAPERHEIKKQKQPQSLGDRREKPIDQSDQRSKAACAEGGVQAPLSNSDFDHLTKLVGSYIDVFGMTDPGLDQAPTGAADLEWPALKV